MLVIIYNGGIIIRQQSDAYMVLRNNKIQLKYKELVIAEYDMSTYVFKDYRYRYIKLKGADSRVHEITDSFRNAITTSIEE